MTLKVSLICIFLLPYLLKAQIGFDTHLIDENEKEAFVLKVGDADNDGDLDVFYCSWTEGRTGWYDNMDGAGDFSAVHIIDNGSYLTRNIDLGDLNGDGNLDLILSISDLNEIRWMSGDGEGNFSPEDVISSNSESVFAAKAFDLDGDGDLDILSASYGDHTIAWHENIDGQGFFGNRKILSTGARNASDVTAADIDDDGDLDVFYTSIGDNTTAWVKNMGNGSFGSEQILTAFTINPTKIQLKDLDLDGDLDVFVTAQSAKTIVYWENLDGLGGFSTRKYISVGTSNASTVVSTDVDSDGDMDFILANWNNPKITWQENYDGKLNLGQKQTIGSSLYRIRSIVAADINGDGDQDLVVAANEGGKIEWLENKNLISNVISGKVRIELEHDDCEVDATPLPLVRLDAQGSTDTVSTYSIETGYYQLYPGIGTYYTSPQLNLPDYFSAFPEDYETSHDDIGNIDYQDFCVLPTEDATDVSVILSLTTIARPGFVTPYDILMVNRGSITESGEVIIKYDETKFEFINSDLTVISTSTDEVVLSYSDLKPLSTKKASIRFRIPPPPEANIGEIVTFTTRITPTEEDRIPDDNIFNLTHELRGSYDPNDIRVMEGSQILLEQSDQFLHYIIRFQNTGTASAINVRVENVLDEHLDWSTFTPISMSHNGHIHIAQNKDVTFDFRYINLPDSLSDEPGSHGTITYKIKPKVGIDIGDSIKNVADIYFDFNPPIITNTVITEVIEPTSTGDLTAFDLNLYPNPVLDILHIDMDFIPSQIIIYNLYGQEMKSTHLQKFIDIHDLKSGLYYARILMDDHHFETRKFMKSN